MLLITTPTGKIGSQVLTRLLDGSEPIRVIARDPAKLSEHVRDRVEIVEGSHSDADVVDKAIKGVDALFWLVPGDPTAESANAAFVDFSAPAGAALKMSGIRHVVAVSALGRGWRAEAGHVTATLRADDLMARTGVAFRALACGTLMENFLGQAGLIREKGIFSWPSPGDQKTTAVATRDIAANAAQLLQQRSWGGVEEIPLKGPEELTFDEMAEIMSNVLSISVRFESMAMKDMHAMMISRGSSQGMADAMVAMLTAKNEGMDEMIAGPTPDRTPTTYSEWCRDILKPSVEV